MCAGAARQGRPCVVVVAVAVLAAEVRWWWRAVAAVGGEAVGEPNEVTSRGD